jgi:hypothetical protein
MKQKESTSTLRVMKWPEKKQIHFPVPKETERVHLTQQSSSSQV